MPTYKQYFLGGPYHGMEATPDAIPLSSWQGSYSVSVPIYEPLSLGDFEDLLETPTESRMFTYTYQRRKFLLLGEQLIFWVGTDLDLDGHFTRSLVGILLLRPHQTADPAPHDLDYEWATIRESGTGEPVAIHGPCKHRPGRVIITRRQRKVIDQYCIICESHLDPRIFKAHDATELHWTPSGMLKSSPEPWVSS